MRINQSLLICNIENIQGFEITCDITVSGMLNQKALFQCNTFTYQSNEWKEIPGGYQQFDATATYEPTAWSQVTFALRKSFFVETLGKNEQTLCAVVTLFKAKNNGVIHHESSATFVWNQEIWGGETSGAKEKPSAEDLLREGNERRTLIFSVFGIRYL